MVYQLVRSKRKTIAISFDRDGNLIVKAPFWIAQKEIEAFLYQKEKWIEQTKIQVKNSLEKEKNSKIFFENGDILFLLGEKRVLTVLREERKTGRVKCLMDRILMWVPYDADYEFKRNTVERWYRREARILLQEKAEEFAKKLRVSYLSIHIKDQKSCWGSCSSKKNLNFNWRIIMAPEPVCDYIVIHELCHLVHMNHSPEFWSLVATICPQYKQYRKWLKDNQNQLYRI